MFGMSGPLQYYIKSLKIILITLNDLNTQALLLF